MDLRYKHACPQCGAPIELKESERLLQCDYCGVRNYLCPSGTFHFTLPHKAHGQDIIYAPYMRFKGNVFSCHGAKIDFRYVDVTQIAAPLTGAPATLGFRPQAMPLKLIPPSARATFIKPSLTSPILLNKASQIGQAAIHEEVYHRGFIGDTTSLIHLPLYIQENKLMDAVTDEALVDLEPGFQLDKEQTANNAPWRLTVLATICPVCGWNLEGEKDSVALLCLNCSKAWEAVDGRLSLVDHQVVPDVGNDLTYLPFWKMTTNASGLSLKTFEDFIKIAKQPRAFFDARDREPMNFWSPAFKIRPKLFLNLLRNTTLAQPSCVSTEPLKGKRLFPVTLSSEEAFQTCKLTLAATSIKKNDVFPLLPRVRFAVDNLSLVYLAFMDIGHELIQPCTQITINKNALSFGHYL